VGLATVWNITNAIPLVFVLLLVSMWCEIRVLTRKIGCNFIFISDLPFETENKPVQEAKLL
jgi:hypothetical protein